MIGSLLEQNIKIKIKIDQENAHTHISFALDKTEEIYQQLN